MFEVRNLSVAYGKAVAIEGININVSKGEFVAVIGANGAGKTTTLNAVMGLVPAVSGTILHGGQAIDGLPTERRVARGIVLVPENRDLFGPLSVQDNLRLGGYLHRYRYDGSSLERVYDLLPKLKERRNQEVKTLSGGEQQMVAVGRALMAEPQVILLDEPSIGLAPRIVEQIFEAITRLKKSGMTAIIVEQNAKLALSVTERAYVMELGRIVIEGRSEDLVHNSSLQAAYLGERIE
ncbi:ABC transporter ATP-binding protein [Bradyrhizobium sp. CCBAU 25338]|jgi:branched-chain amino acid transport system ATP-binding protein|uniref:ABC transporter ATP-binding protein n=1 Tax=Bradyrhizobium sp. CCBAU 25338 TaxID=1641877 RepID=UPI002304A779|nr:ABC transporter ATP-binding protein [Bradyrhizobium sp. CCBAU 25338]